MPDRELLPIGTVVRVKDNAQSLMISTLLPIISKGGGELFDFVDNVIDWRSRWAPDAVSAAFLMPNSGENNMSGGI